jgi:hypothetical protein
MKAEELRVKLAERVRGDSKYLADLSSADTLMAAQLGLKRDDIEAKLLEIAKMNSSFRDIRSIQGPTGKVYFYSETYMTETYARILARVKAEDPCLTIAETVREESRVYPRVTSVELFKYGLFKIDRDQLDDHVARTLERYEDIKSIKTSTGSVYLYSNQYLTPDWAAFLAKKQERPDN